MSEPKKRCGVFVRIVVALPVLFLFCGNTLATDLVHSTDYLSEARAYLGATTINNLALFAGGYNEMEASKVVDIYNYNTGQWSIDTLGFGTGGSQVATSVGSKAIFTNGAEVNIYDTDTSSWSPAMLSQIRGGVAATSVDNLALFAGGGGFVETPFDTVDIYNNNTGLWSTATLSQARGFMAATTVGQKAIFAGGTTSLNRPMLPCDQVDIYDNNTGIWSTASLSEARADIAVTTVGQKAIFAGGDRMNFVGVSESDMVDIYDASTGQWTTARLSQARTGISATTLGNLAIFAGGRYDGFSLSDIVDIYNAETGVWSIMTLSEARFDLAATTVGDMAIFAGGINYISTPPDPFGADLFLEEYSSMVDIFTIPEPGTLVLLGLGGISVIIRRAKACQLR